MKKADINERWTVRKGFLDSVAMLDWDKGTVVNLPHDDMIGTSVSADAPAGPDSGYFKITSGTVKSLYAPY